MTQNLRSLGIIIFSILLAAGCTTTATPNAIPEQSLSTSLAVTSTTTANPTPEVPAEPAATIQDEISDSTLSITHQRLDGNRIISGSGGMPTESLDIPISGKPLWVVAVPVGNRIAWVVALVSGDVQGFFQEGTTMTDLDLNLAQLPPGMPPILRTSGSQIELIAPAADASPSTNPILSESGALAYIDILGQLHLAYDGETQILAVDALPDARILSDQKGRLLFLSGPSDKYPHGVLGDELEATSITLVDTQSDPVDIQVIPIDDADVIEGISPIWVDLDNDGELEIIVTQSNEASGSRIVVYREDGNLFARGEPIGQGYRWRHQLAVGQFIPGGTNEIAVIRTPHIGGVLEIYSLLEDRLEISAVLGKFGSHLIGSRNLDSALAADFNGDGIIEIVVPDQSRITLTGIQWYAQGAEIVWEAPAGGKITTNLAAATLADGRLVLGVGNDNNLLRIWIP